MQGCVPGSGYVPGSCPVGATCTVPVNCINKYMLDSDHVALVHSGGILARTRPMEAGAVTRPYNLGAGGDTTPCLDTQYEVGGVVNSVY